MKNLILMVVVIIAFTITSCKEDAAAKVSKEKVEKAETRDANSGKFPKMEFTETEFDFGTIDQGTNVEHVFEFKNTGEAPLVIVNAKSSCG